MMNNTKETVSCSAIPFQTAENMSFVKRTETVDFGSEPISHRTGWLDRNNWHPRFNKHGNKQGDKQDKKVKTIWSVLHSSVIRTKNKRKRSGLKNDNKKKRRQGSRL